MSLILIVSMGSFVLNKNVSRSLTHVNPTHVEQEQCHVYRETRVNVSVLQELWGMDIQIVSEESVLWTMTVTCQKLVRIITVSIHASQALAEPQTFVEL